MSKKIVIVAGGPRDLWPDISNFLSIDTIWFGVDRGAHFLLDEEIVPEWAIGDFDSLAESELKRVEEKVSNINYAKPEKDETDTQLALSIAMRDYPELPIYLIGATGGRLDHFLSNLWLVLEPRYQQIASRLTLMDAQNTITYYLPGDHCISKEADKFYLAYVCLTPVSELTLVDAKYTLTKQEIPYPVSLASNEFVGEKSHFSFTSGLVAVIQSKDK